jgi:hypothetical protein
MIRENPVELALDRHHSGRIEELGANDVPA